NNTLSDTISMICCQIFNIPPSPSMIYAMKSFSSFSFSLLNVSPILNLLISDRPFQPFLDFGNIFVPSARQTDDKTLFLCHPGRHLQRVGDGMGAFKGRDDAFGP